LCPYAPEGIKTDQLIAYTFDNQSLHNARFEAEINDYKFKTIVENIPGTIFHLNENFEIVYLNSFDRIPKENKTAIMGASIFDVVEHKTEADKLKEVFLKVQKTLQPHEYEFEYSIGEEELRYYKINCTPIINNAKIGGYLIIYSNITEHKKKEKETKVFKEKLEELVADRTVELQKANDENIVLLQEMHHRVKNNLQIISSLLNLQSSFVGEDARQILVQCQNRILSMALVHEMLYNNKQLSAINIREYLQTLARNNLYDYIEKHPIQCKVNVNTQNEITDVGVIITLGLIVNELLSNSIKHAFQHVSQANIVIELQTLKDQTHNTVLCYSDNGSGIPKENKHEGMGTLLLESFVEQLGGKIMLNSSPKGIQYEIKFNC
jgi:PAS domain S-box-containing protein